MEVELAPEIEAILRAKVATGEYPSLAALVEDALFLLVERDWRAAQANLRSQVPAMFGPEQAGETNPEVKGT